jgi:hypothetical protein
MMVISVDGDFLYSWSPWRSLQFVVPAPGMEVSGILELGQGKIDQTPWRLQKNVPPIFKRAIVQV